jgi:glycosyltransferase involved in cell wall biosynthesis
MLASSLSGIPFSYTLHGPTDLYEPYTWQLSEKTTRAKFVACISHFARSQAMNFSDPQHWDKLHVVHCGVIPELYDRPAPDAGSTGSKTAMNLLFIGRLSPTKGLRVLMEAFAAARTDYPDLRLTLVGDGNDRPHLEELAAPLGDAVRFAGFQSQEGVARALAAADALVLPSFAEGLPVVLMEALAAGKPVICTQVAGVGELVEHGVSGLIVPAGDAESLANCIRTLADDSDRRGKMGEAGRQKVRAEFDVRREAARIGALFAGTGGGGGIRPPPYEEA